jgi:hypothetical protein
MQTQMMLGRVVQQVRGSGEIVYDVTVFQTTGGVPEVLDFGGVKASAMNFDWYLQGENMRTEPVAVVVDFHCVTSARKFKDMTFTGYDLRLRGVRPLEGKKSADVQPSADQKKAS